MGVRKMVLLMVSMTVSFAFAVGVRQEFEEPTLCGKSLITNSEFKRYVDERNISTSSNSAHEDEERGSPPLNLIPYVASVQRFDIRLDNQVDIFDKRLTGAFAGTILGPTVVLVACRCVARHLGLVGGDDQSVWDPRQFGVMAGTPWDYSPVHETVGQIRFANRIVVHPKCELGTSFFLWDMAVLVVKSPFKFITNKVGAAPIPGTSKELKEFLELAASQRMSYFTAGWGWSFNSHKPHHLELKLHPLFVRDWKSCYQSSAGHGKANLTGMYACVETAASYLRLRRTGDIGSPLLGFLGVKESIQTIQYVVLGIKSKEDGATPDGFSLFTRLDVDLDWLGDMKRNPPQPTGTASTTNFGSILKVSLFIVWTHILNALCCY